MKKLALHIDKHETEILIGRGLFSGLKSFSDRNLVFLVDENVLRLYNEQFAEKNCIVIPQGEKYKSLAFVEDIYRKMLSLEVDRSSFLVGVGGGLVTDIAGYVASSYMRGIDFGFISSTLLGQVDASIGGKNGVNLDGYKNMIGSIRQPEFVWCDLDLLQTLEHKELVSGFSEVIKYGAIRDLKLFNYLEENVTLILNLNPEALERIIAGSAAIKVQIVQSDVSENADRKLLNFGHTLGHAIEKITGMLHGEAIAIGMVLAGRLSVNLGFLKEEEADRLELIIKSAGLPVKTNIPSAELFKTLLKDKKRKGRYIHFILLKAVGEAFIQEMELETLKNVINDLY